MLNLHVMSLHNVKSDFTENIYFFPDLAFDIIANLVSFLYIFTDLKFAQTSAKSFGISGPDQSTKCTKVGSVSSLEGTVSFSSRFSHVLSRLL